VNKLLLAPVGAAVLVGIGLAIFFGLFGDRGDGETASGQTLTVSTYSQAVGQQWSCDDIREIVNPKGTEQFPAIVAVVEAPELQVRLGVSARYLRSHMIGRAKNGEPFGDEQAALRDIEDGYILYIAAVKDGLGVSEDEARTYLKNQAPGFCDVTVEGASESDTLRTIQVERTKTRIVQKMLKERKPGEDVYQLMAARIAHERPAVRITEVAFAAAGGLECTRDGARVDCPSDLPTPVPTTTP